MENRKENVKQQSKQQRNKSKTPDIVKIQKRKNTSSTGSTPMKIPKSAEVLKEVQGAKNDDEDAKKDEQEILELCITPAERKAVCQQNQNQEEVITPEERKAVYQQNPQQEEVQFICQQGPKQGPK